jgi:hypothetical protein
LHKKYDEVARLSKAHSSCKRIFLIFAHCLLLPFSTADLSAKSYQLPSDHHEPKPDPITLPTQASRQLLEEHFPSVFVARGHKRPMNSCMDILDTLGTSKHFLNSESVVDTQFYTKLTADCLATRLNYEARPFETSFIPADFFTKEMFDKAPYRLGMNTSLSELEDVLKHRPNATWAESDPTFTILEKNAHGAILRLQGAQQTVSITGRGDMNGDGIEDIALKIVNNVDYPASYFSVGLYVLTRLSEDGPYTIIDAYTEFENIPDTQ